MSFLPYSDIHRLTGLTVTIVAQAGIVGKTGPTAKESYQFGYSRVKLSEAGIDHKLSSRAQKKASLPKVEQERLNL